MDKLGLRQLGDIRSERRSDYIILLSVLLSAVACAAACAVDSSPKTDPVPLPLWSGSRHLDSAEESPEALAKRLLRDLAQGDLIQLKRLRITKQEYCSILWPELPGSRIPNLSCDFAWDQATLRSNAGLNEMIAQHKGRAYRLVSLTVRNIEPYQTFKALKEPYIRIRDEKGVEQEVRIFGSILELDGQYKLFSFVAD